jgi:hypothetical protein
VTCPKHCILTCSGREVVVYLLVLAHQIGAGDSVCIRDDLDVSFSHPTCQGLQNPPHPAIGSQGSYSLQHGTIAVWQQCLPNSPVRGLSRHCRCLYLRERRSRYQPLREDRLSAAVRARATYQYSRQNSEVQWGSRPFWSIQDIQQVVHEDVKDDFVICIVARFCTFPCQRSLNEIRGNNLCGFQRRFDPVAAYPRFLKSISLSCRTMGTSPRRCYPTVRKAS